MKRNSGMSYWVIPFNPYFDYGEPDGCGTARTIKAQYWKNSLANFLRQDGLGATAVTVIYETS